MAEPTASKKNVQTMDEMNKTLTELLQTVQQMQEDMKNVELSQRVRDRLYEDFKQRLNRDLERYAQRTGR